MSSARCGGDWFGASIQRVVLDQGRSHPSARRHACEATAPVLDRPRIANSTPIRLPFTPPHVPIAASCPRRHPLNGDTCDPAKGPIGRFRGSAKAPSTSGVQTNLGLLSAAMRHPSLVSCLARARRRPTFLVRVARPRPPLLSECSSLRMRGGPPSDEAHERTTRQLCDELPVHFADSVCGAR